MIKSFLTIFLATQLVLSYGAKCVYYGSPSSTGEQTANGEKFYPMGFTASTLPHLPFGTIIQVTNMINGRSVQVRVNDRFGVPPAQDTIDLSYGAFAQIANHHDGVVPCSYIVL